MEARTYEAGSVDRARAILTAQESQLTALHDEGAEVAVWLASARGMIALIANDAKAAVEQFGTAYQRASVDPDFDAATRLTLKQRLAFAHIRRGDGAEAERLFHELIESFTALQGPQSASVLRVRLNLAQAFMIQNKHEQAVEETTEIYPAYVASLGEDHELAMQVLTTRAQSEGSLERWDAAVRDDLKVYELAVRKRGPLSFFALATLSDAALAQCRAGRPQDGEPNARRAFELSTRAFGPRAGLTGGAAYTLASCAIALGRVDEAESLLKTIDVPAVAQLSGTADWDASLDLLRADIALRRHDGALARRLLEAATPMLTRPGAEPYQKHAVERLAQALRRNGIA
jgi:tetratricopeptide (TPR) repeat protein